MKKHLYKIVGAIIIIFGGALIYEIFFVWKSDKPPMWTGYVEGDFVWIGLPEGGILEHMEAYRSQQVVAGQTLFILDSVSEQAGLNEAKAALKQATSNRDDLLKGERPSEIDALLAQKKEAEATLELNRLTYIRLLELLETNDTSQQDTDQARANYESAEGALEAIEANIVTAKLPARSDEIKAADAAIEAAQGTVDNAEWQLARRTAHAPTDALVYDIIFYEGEFLAAGQGAVSLLPPQNIKVRFFVSEADLPTLSYSQTVMISCDGCPGQIPANITFISPEAEYTPPVIYSESARQKLVYLIEARPVEPMVLRPGQPVDITLP